MKKIKQIAGLKYGSQHYRAVNFLRVFKTYHTARTVKDALRLDMTDKSLSRRFEEDVVKGYLQVNHDKKYARFRWLGWHKKGVKK